MSCFLSIFFLKPSFFSEKKNWKTEKENSNKKQNNHGQKRKDWMTDELICMGMLWAAFPSTALSCTPLSSAVLSVLMHYEKFWWVTWTCGRVLRNIIFQIFKHLDLFNFFVSLSFIFLFNFSCFVSFSICCLFFSIHLFFRAHPGPLHLLLPTSLCLFICVSRFAPARFSCGCPPCFKTCFSKKERYFFEKITLSKVIVGSVSELMIRSGILPVT